ncbi:hypothetical protein [Castellaniella sp.]|uniref:hypothetical protein n=1 Tax=Castellaniella sp. TaxID=1955812 RepID=UPI002AFFC3A2|nr:hypothetical protein [Castellaniella sp.]
MGAFMQKINNFIRDFRHDERGAVAIISILSFAVILASSLFAVDMVRHNVAQAKMQSALDTTVISAGRKLAILNPNDPDQNLIWQQDACNYFMANMPSGFMGLNLTCDDLKINYMEDKAENTNFRTAQRVAMSVSTNLPLLSMGYFKQPSWPIAVTNEARRKVRNDLELVLALDNSGSMDEGAGGGKSRMQVLKTSTKDLIKTVMDAAAAGAGDYVDVDDDEVRGAFIGLVPFNDVVNVSAIPTAKSWMTGWLNRFPDQENYVSRNWSGCIVEPEGNWTANNRLPAAALTPTAGFQPLVSIYSVDYGKSSFGLSGNQSLVFNDNYSSGVGFGAPSDKDKDRRINAEFVSGSNPVVRTRFSLEPQYCARSNIKFFIGTEDELDHGYLRSSVDAMQSYGGTNVGMGLIWAWRMLDPSWRGTGGWGNEGLPRDYNTDKLNKVIVLLSDGDNAPSGVVKRQSEAYSSGFAAFSLNYAYKQSNNTYEGSKTISLGSLSSFNQCPVSGLRILNPNNVTGSNYNSNCTKINSDIGWAGTSPGTEAITKTAMDNYMTQLCSNIKAKGIRIFTLTLSNDVKEKSIMKNCSSGDNYYDVSDASKLPEAFAQIAGALTELRLIK